MFVGESNPVTCVVRSICPAIFPRSSVLSRLVMSILVGDRIPVTWVARLICPEMLARSRLVSSVEISVASAPSSAVLIDTFVLPDRSEERRVGKEC